MFLEYMLTELSEQLLGFEEKFTKLAELSSARILLDNPTG